jgi:hypothetical protein
MEGAAVAKRQNDDAQIPSGMKCALEIDGSNGVPKGVVNIDLGSLP